MSAQLPPESPPVAAAEARAVAPLLVEVAALLSSAQISVVVVCDAAGAPLGVITETVLVRRLGLGLGQADFFSANGVLQVSESQRGAALALCHQSAQHAALACLDAFSTTDFRNDLKKESDRAHQSLGPAHPPRRAPQRAGAGGRCGAQPCDPSASHT
ncbi:MAG: hypothetical protein RL260_2776 [Pseudomonadota bacterium]